MMRWVYDLGFLIFGVASLPRFLKKIKPAEDRAQLIRERLGFLSPERLVGLRGNRPLWIHSVSVGEVLAIEKFLRLLLEKRPDLHVILTTVTPTGQQVAKQWEGERVRVFYFPFDLRSSVRRFFETLRPRFLLLVETEIWPNVIEEACRKAVPISVVNGRLSERSFQSFRRLSMIFKPLLRKIDFFLVQTEKDRDRLIALDVDQKKVKVTGNMKLDAFDLNGYRDSERASLRQKWGFLPSDQVLIGGSTHPGEEEVLFRVLRHLRELKFPLKLLLAPRHIERSPKILDQARKHGFEAVLASTGRRVPAYDILILDQLGELRKLYALGDVVVMGGSLVRHGGQNPVEPAAFRRAIIHGPWVFNFEDLYRRLEEAGGSLRVGGEEELIFALKRILPSDCERQHLGDQAYKVFETLRGASERNFNWVSAVL